jgi:hypothetical protein
MDPNIFVALGVLIVAVIFYIVILILTKDVPDSTFHTAISFFIGIIVGLCATALINFAVINNAKYNANMVVQNASEQGGSLSEVIAKGLTKAVQKIDELDGNSPPLKQEPAIPLLQQQPSQGVYGWSLEQ